MSINHVLIANGAYTQKGDIKIAVQSAKGFYINGNDEVRKDSGGPFTTAIFVSVSKVLKSDGFTILNGAMKNLVRPFASPFRIVGRFYNELVFLWFCRRNSTRIWAMPLAEVPPGVLFNFEKIHLVQ